MDYKYIYLDDNPEDIISLVYFQDAGTRSHIAHKANNIPIYCFRPYYSLRSYWIPKWYNSLLGCLDYCTSPKGDSHQPDIEETVLAVSYIIHNKALRDKWSSIMTLDPDYLKLYNSLGHRELHEDIELAGYKDFCCKVRQLNGV